MITGNLEYVTISLPYLSFQDTDEERSKVFSILRKYAGPADEEKNLITILDDEASRFLSKKASQVLQQINLESIQKEVFRGNRNKVLAAFSNYVYALKKSIEQLRISRKNNSDSSLTKKHLLPLKPGTPLEEEIQLLKLQWDKLEELSIGHYADFGSIIIYKLKLLLLLRWWSFDQKKGFEVFLQTTKKT